MRLATSALLVPAAILAAPLVAQPAAAPAPAGPTELSRIPGVTIKYYDVAGSTPGKILAAMKSARPRDVTGKVHPSSARWSIGVDVRKATTGKQCRVVRATALFKAEVDFPRLVIAGKEEEAPGEEKMGEFLKRWNDHVAKLDRQQAAYLSAIRDRLPEVERAAIAGGCDGARAAAERVIARIRQGSPSPPGP